MEIREIQFSKMYFLLLSSVSRATGRSQVEMSEWWEKTLSLEGLSSVSGLESRLGKRRDSSQSHSILTMMMAAARRRRRRRWWRKEKRIDGDGDESGEVGGE